MKKRIRKNMFIILNIMLVVLFLASWIAGIYVDGVNGLLSPDGIKWIASNGMANFRSAKLVEIACALAAFSVFHESRIKEAFHSHASVKQRFALKATIVIAIGILAIFSLMLFLPNAILLSSLGTISNSPFSKGAYGFVVSFIILIGYAYGYLSGRFQTLDHFVYALTSILRKSSTYFVYLFVASQFICCLDYTDIMTFMGNESLIISVIRPVLYYIPLLMYL